MAASCVGQQDDEPRLPELNPSTVGTEVKMDEAGNVADALRQREDCPQKTVTWTSHDLWRCVQGGMCSPTVAVFNFVQRPKSLGRIRQKKLVAREQSLCLGHFLTRLQLYLNVTAAVEPQEEGERRISCRFSSIAFP